MRSLWTRSHVLFFFFKQKTAYEMRISDWSSDVCSSDLLPDESQPLLRWSELAMEEKIDLGGERTITPFRVLHTVPANGYAIEGRSGTLAFTGDTYADDALWHFLNGPPRLDKLIIDVAFPDKEAALGYASKHFTPELLGHELRKLEHKPKLYLTHHKDRKSTRLNSSH